MFKKLSKLVIVLLLAVMVTGTALMEDASATTYTGRTWEYFNFTALLSPNWAFVVMPGHRYEYYRSNDQEEKGTFFYELFAGPVYIQKFNDFTLKLPLWYYYMGFPVETGKFEGKYFYSHNIEFLPIVEYTTGKLKLTNRVIFHNKVYAKNALYETRSQREGFSMLIRELFRVTYSVSEKFFVTIADELFFGVIEDEQTSQLPTGEPFYAKKGFNKNRLYAGFGYKFTPFVSFVPQYVYETNYDPDDDHKLTEIEHYAQFTLNYVLKLY